MLLADGEAALRETRRVLKPGGARRARRLDRRRGEPVERAARRARCVERGLIERPEPGEPGPVRLGRATASIAEHLEDAGFVELEVETVDFAIRYASVDDWWVARRRRPPRASRDADARDGRRDPQRRPRRAANARPSVRRSRTASLVIPARTWVAAATA